MRPAGDCQKNKYLHFQQVWADLGRIFNFFEGQFLTIRPSPLSLCPIARVAQLVEHNLAKVGVASSNLVSRSKSAFHSGFFVFQPLVSRPWARSGRKNVLHFLSKISRLLIFMAPIGRLVLAVTALGWHRAPHAGLVRGTLAQIALWEQETKIQVSLRHGDRPCAGQSESETEICIARN
jgi:hypothetical protein